MKYTVKSNLKHNGSEYVEGAEIELEEDEAKELLEAGTIVAEGDEETSATDGENTEATTATSDDSDPKSDDTEGGSEGDKSNDDSNETKDESGGL